MPEDFNGRTVLIAGGTGGLGRAVSLAFLGQRAQVIVPYRKESGFAELKASAGAAASSLAGYSVDVTNEASVAEFIAQVAASHGRIDAFVNTVGGYAGGAPLWESEPQSLETMLTLNLRAGYVLARAVVPVMLKQGGGAIVNTAGSAAIDHPAGAAAYAASKAAAVAMMASLAADLKGTGVRVNSILPSMIDTPENRKAMPGADFSKWPKPEAIARVILFLCSEEARLIHGASIPVYGNE